jgi:hypothetical protein
MVLTFIPNDPNRSDQSQQRHEVGCESGEDRMRHGSALSSAGAFYEGKPPESLPAVVVGTFGTLADCDATATPPASVSTIPNANHPGITERNIAHIPQVADPQKLSCVLTGATEDNSPDLSAIPVSREPVPATAPDAGIDAAAGETCPACMGSGRGHFGRCSICLGSGVS